MKTILAAILGLITAILIYFQLPSGYEIVNVDPVGETIVCFGDSLTYGTGATRDNAYPAQLSRLIGREVINAGVPGETTAAALRRVEEIIPLKPGVVMITLGGNDLKNGVNRGEAFRNLEQIIRKFQSGRRTDGLAAYGPLDAGGGCRVQSIHDRNVAP